MTDYEYYLSIATYRCQGCPAYEEIGYCGAIPTCAVSELDDFLEEMAWDVEYLLDRIAFEDYVNPEILQAEEEFFESIMCD